MRVVLHIPGERPRALRWTVHDPRSRYGQGVLLHKRGTGILDGFNFRLLRDGQGAWLETNKPDQARRAMGLPLGESLGTPRAL